MTARVDNVTQVPFPPHAPCRPPAQASQGKSWDNRQRVWVDDPGTALALDDDAFAGVRQQWNASAVMRCAASRLLRDCCVFNESSQVA